jgi:hypothetical protein
MVERRKRGETLEVIAAAAGISPQAVAKRLPRSERSPEDIRVSLLKRLDNRTIRGMSVPQVTATLRTLSKKGRAAAILQSEAASIDAARGQFREIDLTPFETRPCTVCGKDRACTAEPVCLWCRADSPYDVSNEGWIGRFIQFHPCKSCGVNNATGAGVCNACREALPAPEADAGGPVE